VAGDRSADDPGGRLPLSASTRRYALITPVSLGHGGEHIWIVPFSVAAVGCVRGDAGGYETDDHGARCVGRGVQVQPGPPLVPPTVDPDATCLVLEASDQVRGRRHG
jgi:hypothetical protein